MYKYIHFERVYRKKVNMLPTHMLRFKFFHEFSCVSQFGKKSISGHKYGVVSLSVRIIYIWRLKNSQTSKIDFKPSKRKQ